MSVIINVNELIVNATKDVVRVAIMEISRVYNFDGEEACRMLEVCSVAKSSKSSKSVSEVKQVKASFPLPFNGSREVSCCQSLRQNHGLYTQCQGGRMNGGEFCKNCQTQCDKNGHGVPDYGTIGERMKAHEEGVEFKDPSGKSPTAYSIVMRKLKLTKEQVEEEAGKLNIIINPIHFEEVVTKKSGRPAKTDKPEKTESKQKGRPKKSKKVLELAGEEEDLFASLVMSANKSSEEMSSDEEDKKTVIMSDSEDDEAVEPTVEPTVELTVELVEKPVEKKKKVISEAERLEKESLAKQKKQALEAEKEAKKQALEAEKELAKQKKKAAEEEKAKKDSPKQKKTKKEEVKPAAQVEDEEEADVVKKIEFEGKKYLKSKKTGIIYNMEQDVVGKWNEEKNRVDFNVEEEESEEEYEDDN